MKNKVSVIVPCYNVEKYVKKCINSIISQTFKDIEIILVNDGSIDGTLGILKEFEKNDSRIKVLDKKNGGLSDARNFGLLHSSCEYVCFIDSDDYVDKRYIELLYKEIINEKADIVACDFYYIDSRQKTWSNKEKTKQIYSNFDAIKDFLSYDQNLEVMIWNKLYKKRLFIQNNILFPVGKYNEDNFTTYKLFYFSKKISLIPNKLYFYLQRENSIMGSKFNKKRLDILDSIIELKKFFKSKKICLQSELDAYETIINFTILRRMIKDKYNDVDKNNIMINLKNNFKFILKNKNLPVKIKIQSFLLRINFNLYEKFVLLIGR